MYVFILFLIIFLHLHGEMKIKQSEAQWASRYFLGNWGQKKGTCIGNCTQIPKKLAMPGSIEGKKKLNFSSPHNQLINK